MKAGCKDVTVLKPPGRKRRSWLVKAIVPEADHIGVVAIQDASVDSGVLLLSLVRKKDGQG